MTPSMTSANLRDSAAATRKMDQGQMLSRYMELRDTGEEYGREAVRLCEAIIRSYMPLVRWIAHRQLPKTPRSARGVLDYGDLEAAGMAGLLDALQSHDPYRGGSFTGYAAAMIRWAMIHEVRDLDMIPKHTRRKIKRSWEATERLQARAGREPTVKEAAEEAGISPRQYREHRKWWRLVFTEPLEAYEGWAA